MGLPLPTVDNTPYISLFLLSCLTLLVPSFLLPGTISQTHCLCLSLWLYSLETQTKICIYSGVIIMTVAISQALTVCRALEAMLNIHHLGSSSVLQGWYHLFYKQGNQSTELKQLA